VPAHSPIKQPTVAQWNQVRNAFDIPWTLGDVDAVLQKDYRQMEEMCTQLGEPCLCMLRSSTFVSRTQSSCYTGLLECVHHVKVYASVRPLLILLTLIIALHQ
jgi:hypothetical protein